jgi:DNA-binding response OmpR family regulator
MSVSHALEGRPLILVVDDTASLRPVIARTLLRAGYHVLTASGSAQAIALLEQLQVEPDLAVIDLNLPLVSGEELAGELSRRVPGLPLLFVSSGGHDEDAVLPGLLLEKPFSFKVLCRLVANMLVLDAPKIAVP